MHDLKVWVGTEADGSSSTTTPGKTSGQVDEMSRVAKVRQYTVQSVNQNTFMIYIMPCVTGE